MKKINILVIVVLIAALMGASFLVKSSQETRRGASFASVEALFLPGAKSIKVGERVTTTMMIDSKTHFLTGADLKIKYDSSKLELEKATVLTNSTFSGGITWLQGVEEILIAENDSKQGTYSLVGTSIGKDVKNLPSGVVSVIRLDFVAKAMGDAVVGLDNSYTNIVAGYNAGGSDQELKIEKISEAKYQIVGEITRTPTKIVRPSILPTRTVSPRPTYRTIKPM
ncbi:MAG TPA: hypothetical protein VN174_02850 [Candidatus Methanoperedens sp.]|nr:hypothetical protein [Candidatus Methanoperedens sp.]